LLPPPPAGPPAFGPARATKRRIALTPRGALVAFVLLAFWPTVAQQGVYFYGDASEYVPRLGWAGAQAREGHIPGWNPYLALGIPASTPANTGVYPVDLLLFASLPKEWAYNLDVVFHVLLAALGMWTLARGWGQSPAAAALAGMVWSLGGFTMGHLQHFNILVALAWVPLAFYAVDRVLEAPSRRTVSVAALVVGLDLLGGHVQIVLYTALALAAYGVVGIVSLWRLKGVRLAARTALGLGAAAAGALGLATVFLWPFLEWSRFVSVGEIFNPAGHTLTRSGVIRMVAPFWGGGSRWRPFGVKEFVEHSTYWGLLPLALAVIGLGHQGGKRLFLALLAAAALVLSLGPRGPLWGLVGGIPFVGWGRTPVRYLMFVQFAVALLSGFGLDLVARSKRTAWSLAAVLLAAAAAVVVICMVRGAPPEPLPSGGRSDPPALNQPDTAVLLAAFVGSAALLWVLSRTWAPFSRRVVLSLTLAFVGADLLFFMQNLSFNDLAPRDSYSPSAAAKAILSRGDPLRVFSYSPEGEVRWLVREMIGAALPITFGLRSFSGAGGGLEPLRLWEFRDFVNSHFQRRGARLLGLFSGGYVISRKEIDVPGLELLHSDVVKVYANEKALPLAYFAARSRLVPDRGAALRAIVRADFDPRRTVILEEPGPEIGEEGRAEGSVSIERATPDGIDLDAATPAPAWLVLNEAFGPGWRATVDGCPATILRANFLVRTVLVPAGRHRVAFAYAPVSKKAGMAVSLATLVILLAMAIPGPPRPAPLPADASGHE
jgi:hypothetical protein